MSRSIFWQCALGWCLFFATAANVWGQASITGKISNPAGQGIADVKIELRAAVGDQVLRASSDAHGEFRFPTVEPGEYKLTADAPGYYPTDAKLIVKPRQPVNLAVALTPRESVSQKVEVEASVPDLDTAQTGTSRTLTRAELQSLPAPLRRDVPTLAENLAPGAVLSHDNFVHVRGNELSLHEFINGVSFLDNAHQHFTPGLSPEIFQTVSIVTGGFPAEYGNRFGGVLDVTTRSGRDMHGHGSVSLGVGTVQNHDASAEYGGSNQRWGYYLFAGGFSSDRFLNPPTPREQHDFGYGLRGAAQVDYQGNHDLFKLLLTAGGTDFELPNNAEQEAEGRDASRRLRSQTAILNWQHIFSPRLLLSTSAYQRTVSDRLPPAGTPEEFASASRSTLTAGIKSDVTYSWHGHTFRSGVDLNRLRLRESFALDSEDLAEAFAFHQGLRGGQASLYVQDHFAPITNVTVDAGVRWDHFDLLETNVQVSPRFGVAYHIPQTRSVVHFAYNRFFTPPPIEYALLTAFLGAAAEPDQRTGPAKPYIQNYYEAGWNQQLHPKLILEVSAYAHRGRNAFENTEIGSTRVFAPTNFARGNANGAEVALTLKQLERLGISARLQYAVSKTDFFGPISGGFAGDEKLEPGERVSPAFDQRHTATASLFYRNRWRDFWTGANLRYGSGTPAEIEGRQFRLPQHLTADLATGLALWNREPQRLDFEFDLLNISNSVYQIAKESEVTPIQFAPRRVVSGRLRWRF